MGQPAELINQLLAARAYPHQVDTIQLIETHISWVLLTGEYAYKIKKPVELGFLDFSTLARRRAACELELLLNRRLAREIYLAVVPITGSRAEPRVGGTGEAIEYAVKMRQFSPTSTLDQLLDTAGVEPDLLQAFAEQLAAFHASLPPAPADSDYGSAAKVARDAAENLQQLAQTPFGHANTAALTDLQGWSTTRVNELSDFLRARKAAGFIRECHGDLHLANLVHLGSRYRAFDCLEFSANLRWMDTVDEVAFLFMDLLAHARPDLAFAFLNRYLELSGDYPSLEGLRFYLVYRAVVRSKVWALTTSPRASAADADTCRDRSGVYLQLAREIAQHRRPRLLLTYGPSGSGKSWLSERLAQRLPAFRIRSDVERKRILQIHENSPTGSSLDEGAYTQAMTRQVYEKCAQLAQAPLADGWSVIVDAAALKPWQRDLIRGIAAQMRIPFCVLHCQADRTVLEARVSNRQHRGDDPSEADLAVLHAQLSKPQNLSDGETNSTIRIRTDQAIDWPALITAIKQATI